MAMEKKREIEVRVLWAENLKEVNKDGNIKCYAVVYIESSKKATTTVDERRGANPVWNQRLLLSANDELLSEVLASISVEIYARQRFFCCYLDALVGKSRVLISEVLKMEGGDPSNPLDHPVKNITLPVWRPSGRPQGSITLWIPPTGRFLLHSCRSSLSGNENGSTSLHLQTQEDDNPHAD